MYIAWVWLAPIAYFFAAYMKPAMPGGAWFQVCVCVCVCVREFMDMHACVIGATK